ncbi:hypothetical protein M404DRAFT_247087 [Pisolithus tinctorius Marx 270]|uniref:Uncharacterized protein n=1 Tax=Pisolithus tinctorius Marx 270 TaxID=870435 RepID=A0A0C3NKZ8_PISTI|nr:hypothetical protein M404DRAFT_247087 [Pisolithus tinctorius Marx 270]
MNQDYTLLSVLFTDQMSTCHVQMLGKGKPWRIYCIHCCVTCSSLHVAIHRAMRFGELNISRNPSSSSQFVIEDGDGFLMEFMVF